MTARADDTTTAVKPLWQGLFLEPDWPADDDQDDDADDPCLPR